MEQLAASGAFLATKMNGAPLPKDHGCPVRLIVPGWYGCTCIKWVDEICFVDDAAEATSQMKEFATRTHQNGVPKLASEYKPATIDQAAMPIRVEQWNVDGTTKYNVVGVMWGGHKPTRDLQIRFLPDEAFVPVTTYHQASNATWTLWSQKWTPRSAGVYQIQLKIADATIPTRRLDEGYYVRAINIPGTM
jgi:DMSO/TMAO reductase YedYZ molybdopterin-dependent catalytic subunit